MFKRKSKSTSPTDTIVTSDMAHVKPEKISKPKKLSLKNLKSRFTKKTVRIGTTVIVLVVIAIGGLSTYFFLTGNSTKKPPLKETQAAAIDHASSVVESYFTASEQNKTRLDDTVAKLTDLENRSTSDTQKEAYAGAIVDLYNQAGDSTEAFSATMSAEDSYHSALTAAQLASVYESKKDYANAIKYYELAAERSPKSGPTERSAYNDYNNQAKRLRAIQ